MTSRLELSVGCVEVVTLVGGDGSCLGGVTTKPDMELGVRDEYPWSFWAATETAYARPGTRPVILYAYVYALTTALPYSLGVSPTRQALGGKACQTPGATDLSAMLR